jgi:hypothetical protein
MDINALLQMLQGGGGPSLQGGSGGISAPQAAPMGNPTLQMPQFPGAGSNAGVQQVAAAAHQALSQPQQPPPSMSGLMGSSNPMMMAMLMKRMQGQNTDQPGQQNVATPSMTVSPGSIGGQQLPSFTVPSQASPLDSQSPQGVGGLFHSGFLSRLFGG